MMAEVWFKCKVCGAELLLNGDITMKDLLDGLMQVHAEFETVTMPLKGGDLCRLYSLEWSLKQLRKRKAGSTIKLEESTIRKELEA
jgi:hypothetical protein